MRRDSSVHEPHFVFMRLIPQGWHFRPDWRRRVANSYLAASDPEIDALRAIREEEDAYVRQFYLLLRTGRCMNRDAFSWAHECHANNDSTGAASLIRALTLARVPAREIAVKLRTTRKSIIVFLKLYFDVAAYLDEQLWLASLVFPPGDTAPSLAEQRERYWLAAALLRGRAGLDQALSRKVAMSSTERDELTNDIRAALTARAHDFVLSLHHGFAPANSDDLDRLIRLTDAMSRQPQHEDRNPLMQAFIQGIHQDMKETAALPEFANDPILSSLRETPPQAADSTELASQKV